jgi:hypothetical protein
MHPQVAMKLWLQAASTLEESIFVESDSSYVLNLVPHPPSWIFPQRVGLAAESNRKNRLVPRFKALRSAAQPPAPFE